MKKTNWEMAVALGWLVAASALGGCSAKLDSLGGGNPTPTDLSEKAPDLNAKTPIEGRWVLGCTAVAQLGSFQGEMDFEGNQYLMLFGQYSDSACSQLLNYNQQGGTFALPAAGQIDLSVPDGTTQYNAYALESGVLYFGNAVTNSPATRPTGVNRSLPFKSAGAPILDPSKIPPTPTPTPIPTPTPTPTAPGAPGTCTDFSGQYQMNADLFTIAQTGCTDLKWTTMGDPFEGTPDHTVDYLADGVERDYGRAYFEGDRFVVVKSLTQSVYTLTHTPCDLYNPSPDMIYLMRQVFQASSSTPDSCDFWARPARK